jgi:hypothetical protein
MHEIKLKWLRKMGPSKVLTSHFPPLQNTIHFMNKKGLWAGCPWFTPVIVATWEDDIWKIVVEAILDQKLCEIPHLNGKKVGVVVLLSQQQLWAA